MNNKPLPDLPMKSLKARKCSSQEFKGEVKTEIDVKEGEATKSKTYSVSRQAKIMRN